MNKLCQLYIDNKQYEFQVEGDFFWGEKKLLYQEADNVISKMPWKQDGYAVVELFKKEEFQKLKKSIETNIVKALKQQGLVFNEDRFIIENYHEFVTTSEQHNKVIELTRSLENKDFDFDIDALAKRLG